MSSDPSLFRPGDLPEPKGFHNTGVICHFNSLLQALLACTSAARAVLRNRGFFARTMTGRGLHTLYWHAVPAETRAQIEVEARNDKVPGAEGSGPLLSNDTGGFEGLSSLVLRMLVTDLRMKRPGFAFGPNQESASEGLILLIDMTDVGGILNPLAEVFYHRYRATVLCRTCKKQSDPVTEICVQVKMFGRPATNPEEFAERVCTHYSPLEDYRCEQDCAKKAVPGKPEPDKALRVYQLELLPEIVVCVFNAYMRARDPNARPYFPPEFRVPGADGNALVYREVAQVEHFGNLNGGHYVSQALRAGERETAFNDNSVSPGRFGPESGGFPYLVFYHRTK